MKGEKKGGHPYSREKKQKPKWPTDTMEKNTTTKTTSGRMGMIQATHTHRRYPQEQCLGTKRILRDAKQWGHHKTIRQAYTRKDKRETGEIIRNILN